MSLLEIVAYLMVSIVAMGVVFSKRPVNQLFLYSMYGIVMALLFFVLQAPDVALSEITVGTFIIPIIVLITLMKTGDKT